jgi:hypothetical protein
MTTKSKILLTLNVVKCKNDLNELCISWWVVNFLVFMTFQFEIVYGLKKENSIKFSEIQNLNGSKISKSKNVQYIVCPTFSKSLRTFLTTWYTKKRISCKFSHFLSNIWWF